MSRTTRKSHVDACHLSTVAAGGAVLLDAVSTGDGDVALCFTHDTPFDAIKPAAGVTVRAASTVGNAPLFVVRARDGGALPMIFGGVGVDLRPTDPEPDIMNGRNVGLSTRNGEPPEAVLDWLQWHATHHGMNGAVILNRSRPGTDLRFADDLSDGIRARGIDCHVILVDADRPLGRRDRPAESHPFCVPEAPGKDRMTVPPPAPWESPLADFLFYEWARARFLGAARAVMNIEVHDLIVPHEDGTVFDRAIASETGYLQLVGRHCYPWRVRKGEMPRFADHNCVQFDAGGVKRRWCVAPSRLPRGSILRPIRVGGAMHAPDIHHLFFRFMGLRHPTDAVSTIVPKTSLIEHPPLMRLMEGYFDHKPVRMPSEKVSKAKNGRRAIITTMKNEGPFILEWIAYHRAIGFDDFLIYTNDCSDGTVELLDLLQDRGIVQRRDNPFQQLALKPQHAALQDGEELPVMRDAEWCICMDVDEYVNIKCGDGTLDALFDELGDVNMISCTWRLFGNADVHEFKDGFIIEQFCRSAREFANKPHQAWGFKTLYKNIGLFKKMGVHRPKGLKSQLWEKVRWVNGSGRALPKVMYRNAWRSTSSTYGYDLVQLNHYAVRSAESFLVKRDRGRVNHVDREQGLAYWFRMNNNAVEETSILKRLPMLRAEFDRLMSDPEIRAAHDYCVAKHREKIDALKATPKYARFYADLTGPRLEKLSKMHRHFGAAVFMQGPDSVPDEVVARDPETEFFFTVKEKKHGPEGA